MIDNKIKATAVLPTILLIGGITVEISIAGVLISYLLSQSNFGIKLSEEALSAANSGIEDSIMKIVRDKNYSSPSSTLFIDYRSSAEVSVCRDVCSGVGKYEINSIGSSLNKRRKIQALITADSLTGEIKTEYIKEISL